jgi:hypothetical protein
MSEKVYVAVCYDRHVDDEITVHETLASAKTKCQAFMSDAEYIRRYGNWREEDVACEYFIGFDFDEAPHARVELVSFYRRIVPTPTAKDSQEGA